MLNAELIVAIVLLISIHMSALSLRRVAVIGGGPAGLVASKQLLDAGFRPKLFTKTIGGMWNTRSNPFWPSMKTNLSKFTCRFSDQAWQKDTAVFPTQSDLNQYLNQYAEKYLQQANVFLNCNVTSVSREPNGEFKLTWTDGANVIKCENFDSVVITTGFFSKPVLGHLEGFSGRVIHSSQYTNPEDFAGRNVVVAGASFSSSEIAADVATVASSVRNVVPRPSWMVPRFLPLSPEKPNTPFLPIDLLFYQLNPAQDTIEARREILIKHDVDRIKSNGYMKCLMGSDANDVMKQLREEERAKHSAAAAQNGYEIPSVQVSISDNFSNMVKAGYVKVVQGYVRCGHGSSVHVAPTSENTPNTTLGAALPPTLPSACTVLDNVDDLILCTGFSPALDFLEPKLREQLKYNPEDSFQPLLLHRDVMHPDIPGLYFVGMYRGPYFAGVELQARAVAAYVAGTLPTPTAEELHAGLQAAALVRTQQPRPQFPHADYIGLCIDWMRDLGLLLKPQASCCNVFSPALLSAHVSGEKESDITVSAAVAELAQVYADCNKGKYLSQSIFRALQGDWDFERTLISHLESSPSGTVVGKISLARHSSQSPDLVYTEKGQFTTSKGMKLDVNGSQYVYVLNEAEDCIDIFFADKETGRERDRIFVSLKVVERTDEGWVAVGEPHLCGQDTYVVKFVFAFQGLSLKTVGIHIDVKGPFKDYQSSTTLVRPV